MTKVAPCPGAHDELEAERAARQQGWERREAELDELRGALTSARENATAAQDALDQARVTHRDDLQRREQAAATRGRRAGCSGSPLTGRPYGRTAWRSALERRERRSTWSDSATTAGLLNRRSNSPSWSVRRRRSRPAPGRTPVSPRCAVVLTRACATALTRGLRPR